MASSNWQAKGEVEGDPCARERRPRREVRGLGRTRDRVDEEAVEESRRAPEGLHVFDAEHEKETKGQASNLAGYQGWQAIE
eukprot:1710394-Lingulodinium_polyedra.AAC.1